MAGWLQVARKFLGNLTDSTVKLPKNLRKILGWGRFLGAWNQKNSLPTDREKMAVKRFRDDLP